LTREPLREAEDGATSSSLLLILLFDELLKEEAENDSQLFVIEDEDDDGNDTSLPVSETTVGELRMREDLAESRAAAASDEVIVGTTKEEDEEGADRFLPLALAAGIVLLPPEATAALATNSSRYMVCRSTFPPV